MERFRGWQGLGLLGEWEECLKRDVQRGNSPLLRIAANSLEKKAPLLSVKLTVRARGLVEMAIGQVKERCVIKNKQGLLRSKNYERIK